MKKIFTLLAVCMAAVYSWAGISTEQVEVAAPTGGNGTYYFLKGQIALTTNTTFGYSSGCEGNPTIDGSAYFSRFEKNESGNYYYMTITQPKAGNYSYKIGQNSYSNPTYNACYWEGPTDKSFQLTVPANVHHINLTMTYNDGKLQTTATFYKEDDTEITAGCGNALAESGSQGGTQTEEGITVTATKVPSSWTEVYLWAWTDKGDLFSAWPGQKLTKDANGHYSYTFDSSITKVNVIFSNGKGAQTDNEENITSSVCYVVDGTTAVVDANCDGEAQAEKVVVKFLKPSDWTKVCGYSWTGSTEHLGKWPGTELTVTDGWASAEIPVGASIIFNNNAGKQTENIVNVTKDICYELAGTGADNALAVKENTTCTATGNSDDEDDKKDDDKGLTYTVTVPAGTADCYIVGDWDNWASFNKMTKQSDTKYTITIANAATTHEYKYTCGADWAYVEVRDADANRTYNANDVVSAWKAQPGTEVTVKLYVPDTWTKVYYYAWGASSTADYPGNEITKKTNGWAEVEVLKGANIIFNSGQGGEQTVNIENVQESVCYELGAKNDEGKYAVAVNATCTHESGNTGGEGNDDNKDTELKTIYLVPSIWATADEPSFWVHAWGGAAECDKQMSLVSGSTTVYEVSIPADETHIIFARCNASVAAPLWTGVWNKTDDEYAQIPSGKNQFTIKAWHTNGEEGHSTGTWGVYGESSEEGGDTGFGLKIGDKTYKGTNTGEQWEVLNVEVEKDASIRLYNFGENQDFGPVVFGGEASAEFTFDATAKTVVAKAKGVYNFYIKLEQDNDQLYVAKVSGGVDNPDGPDNPDDPTKTGFGIQINGTTLVKGEKLDDDYVIDEGTDHEQRWQQYAVLGVELKANDIVLIYNYSTEVPFSKWLQEGSTENFTLDNGNYVCLADGKYDFYIKLQMDNDMLYVGEANGGQGGIGNADDYYLVGYINGADYGLESDWNNLGEYKFVNGTVKATFAEASYVCIKTGDGKVYMTDGWLGEEVTTATLYLSSTLSEDANKLLCPAAVELTFTLVVNDNGTLILSYTTKDNASGLNLIEVLNANEPMYNVLGQRVDMHYKGIVIQSGRKFLQK